ncbi:MAG: LAGLIDADG family homing endonuclease, partial [Polyangiaceae bacterium]
MQIAQRLAGYSLGGADVLRRAMGKKKPEEMAKQKSIFLEGSLNNDVTQEDAERIFGLLEYFAGYGFNKCVHGDTEIVDADTGRPTTVQRLFEDRRAMRVHALGPDGRLKARRVLDVVHNGVKPVFELETALGHRIVATGTHRFKTLDGYVPLSELSVGDRIAAPRRLPVTGVRAMEAHELIVLAGLIAEGNTCHPTCLYFYSNDEEHVDDFVRAVSCFPETAARVTRRGERREVCVSTGTDTRFAKGSRPWNAAGGETNAGLRSGAYTWAEALEIVGRKATDKRVPEVVFGLEDELVALFVGRLWAGDGFIAGAGNNNVPFYATSSTGLARDVQALLLRLGITSGVHEKRFKYRGEERLGYTVHVLGDGMVRRFFELVTPHCVGRDEQVSQLEQHLGSRSDDRSSNEAASSDIFWDTIVSITPYGTAPTYDLTVEEDHNFVANGLIVHNSHSA